MAKAARKSDKDDAYLTRVKAYFDQSRSLNATSRERAAKARTYYDGEGQLTTGERGILSGRGQPPIINNRVQRAIDGVLGVLEQGKTDPRAYMRNRPEPKPQQPQAQQPMAPGQPPPPKPKDYDAADVATMTLRYVADINEYSATKMDVAENTLIEGMGGVIIEVVQFGEEDPDILISHVRHEELVTDPYSRRADFSDGRYLGIAKWMYADDIASTWPEAAKDVEGAIESGSVFGTDAYDPTWEDRPALGASMSMGMAGSYIDRKQKRVMVVDLYHRESGKWKRCVFWGGGILEEGDSAYVNDKKETVCPIEATSCYVDSDNVRYGLVQNMIDLQDEINRRRSLLLYKLSVRQIQRVDPATPAIDVELARQEAARIDGVLPAGWQFVSMDPSIQGQFELLAESKAEMDRMAPMPALTGREAASASGRAQQVRAQAGMTELARPLGRLRTWDLRVQKQVWWRARQFYKAPKWIRITNDIGAPEYARVNEPEIQEVPVQDPQTGHVVMMPQQIGVKNEIAKMDVDIVVDSVPDTATLEQEIWGDFLKLAQAYIGTPQQVPFKTLVRLSPLPKRYELLNQLEADQAEMAQSLAQSPQMQYQQAQAGADIAETQSQTAKNAADAKLTEVKTVREAMEGTMSARQGTQPAAGASGANGMGPPQGSSGPPTG